MSTQAVYVHNIRLSINITISHRYYFNSISRISLCLFKKLQRRHAAFSMCTISEILNKNQVVTMSCHHIVYHHIATGYHHIGYHHTTTGCNHIDGYRSK